MLSVSDCESPRSSLRQNVAEEWSRQLKTTKGKVVGEIERRNDMTYEDKVGDASTT